MNKKLMFELMKIFVTKLSKLEKSSLDDFPYLKNDFATKKDDIIKFADKLADDEKEFAEFIEKILFLAKQSKISEAEIHSFKEEAKVTQLILIQTKKKSAIDSYNIFDKDGIDYSNSKLISEIEGIENYFKYFDDIKHLDKIKRDLDKYSKKKNKNNKKNEEVKEL